MAARPRDDILTNTAYYRNGFINVFIAPSKLQIACERVCVRMCMKCDRVSVCVFCQQPVELLELESKNNR